MIYNEENLKLVSDLIVKNLTPDLLPKKYIGINSRNPMFGHCHTASACLYKIFTVSALNLHRAKDWCGVWHWWAVDKSGNIIDLTVDQYHSIGKEPPPYEDGQKSGMLGWAYKTRVLELLERVERDLSD